MKVKEIINGNIIYSEIISSEVLIRNTQNALDLMAEVDSSHIILYDYNFEPDFFDLSTKKLGDILQKFVNYNIKIAIIGDFDKYSSNVLKQYIYETNAVGDFLFVQRIDDVKKKWIK